MTTDDIVTGIISGILWGFACVCILWSSFAMITISAIYTEKQFNVPRVDKYFAQKTFPKAFLFAGISYVAFEVIIGINSYADAYLYRLLPLVIPLCAAIIASIVQVRFLRRRRNKKTL